MCALSPANSFTHSPAVFSVLSRCRFAIVFANITFARALKKKKKKKKNFPRKPNIHRVEDGVFARQTIIARDRVLINETSMAIVSNCPPECPDKPVNESRPSTRQMFITLDDRIDLHSSHDGDFFFFFLD